MVLPNSLGCYIFLYLYGWLETTEDFLNSQNSEMYMVLETFLGKLKKNTLRDLMLLFVPYTFISSISSR